MVSRRSFLASCAGALSVGSAGCLRGSGTDLRLTIAPAVGSDTGDACRVRVAPLGYDVTVSYRGDPSAYRVVHDGARAASFTFAALE